MKQVADAEGEIARRTGEDSVKKEPPNLIELDKMGSLEMDDDDDLLAESVGRPKAKAGAKANSGGGSGGGTKRSTDGATSATFAKRNKVGGSGGGGGGGQTIATSGVKKARFTAYCQNRKPTCAIFVRSSKRMILQQTTLLQ